ncbi:hypothetical protein L596_027795 [Steinernema carpocapsae]|uniref:Uncharacterized protein n=1 Tax=Steinernema carpocapsae TaxID=34508 RepID=A0A4U5LWJ7_STECR|nr:hypothetical protein L596_027795 [Steinernema carpocapsae]
MTRAPEPPMRASLERRQTAGNPQRTATKTLRETIWESLDGRKQATVHFPPVNKRLLATPNATPGLLPDRLSNVTTMNISLLILSRFFLVPAPSLHSEQTESIYTRALQRIIEKNKIWTLLATN